jgi:hypothetical protein
MGKYYLFKENTLYGEGVCQDGMEQAQAYDGLSVGIGDPPAGMKYPAPPEPTYQSQRVQEYPSLASQMDMIWHAMNDGTCEKIEPFYTAILQVKQKYPKD